jgi:hypothetical protein
VAELLGWKDFYIFEPEHEKAQTNYEIQKFLSIISDLVLILFDITVRPRFCEYSREENK